MIKVCFWGTRGSLPVSITADTIRAKIHRALKTARNFDTNTDESIEAFINGQLSFSEWGSYGGNTSCVELRDGGEYILCDAGSGLRDFGNFIMKSGRGKTPAVYNIFLSHLHWDHIHGFPFFTPAFIPGNKINIYGFHTELKETFIRQQEYPNFPVPLKVMRAAIDFHVLEPGKEYEIAGYKVMGIQQTHPGFSYGCSFVKNGKKIVYSTDSEHKDDTERLVKFFEGADLLIFDAQYSLFDAVETKESWGHSSNVLGVELSVSARVRRLCLFHHEPAYSDETIEQLYKDTVQFSQLTSPENPVKVDIAYDGLEIDI
ncbi:MBL fold metallo-hydrolase [Candidatus Magnetominusculus xianensis]|uniref:MBL fold metallo-hydrolase n=1 Tax=Candidatus Magnetominusculus xianensis TaxID=1748249 RepID=A0ABR5SGX9_9BACT|nr:MBL fold metallo-hydrolase [Candidatus Magnetominusculus xianensis]KWT85034.1 MBL fold metallo-hydrolase [Candidatus Magnetominusculus xianensis]MBF0404496.1 MBL fold metallo-hydrolase [Nitrospirota bacterium]